MPDIYRVWIGGVLTNARWLAENLVRTTALAANRKDGVATEWTAVWKYQVGGGNVLAFKARREARYAMTMELKSAPTTAMSDDTEVRLVTYYPDGLQMKKIIFKATYGTIKNGTKYDVQTMLHVNSETSIQPDEWLYLEVLHPTVVLDISESSIDIGCTRWTRAAS